MLFPPLPDIALGFADGRLDRLAHLRDDPKAVAVLRKQASTRALVIAGETPVLKRDRADGARFTFAEVAELGTVHDEVLLGREDGSALFGCLIDATRVEVLKEARPDLGLADLRTVLLKEFVPSSEVSLIGMAKSMLDWHARHRFCARCGHQTHVASSGWRRDCPNCTAQHFPRTDPVAIMLACHEDRVLLGRQPRFPAGMYSCLAGFIEPGETVEAAVRRELFEEAGIGVGRVDYTLSQPWPFPSSLMIGCFAQTLDPALTIDRLELEDARWFSREEVVAMTLGTHPDGITSPVSKAIAHHLIRLWLSGKR
jgi:NAD+ diphosphatase